MEKSTHKAEVVPFVMRKHDNADKLSVVDVFGGYTYVCNTEEWQGVEKAIYFPPDSILDCARPEFVHLSPESKNGKYRVRAKKLRGVVSFGYMIKAPDEAQIGEDWAERLGVGHYDPEEAMENSKSGLSMGEVAKAPNIFCPKYDVDNGRRYRNVFNDGELVVIQEKIHGQNGSFVYLDGDFHCKSRTLWKREYPTTDHITAESLREKNVPEEKIVEIIEGLKNKPKARNSWWVVLRENEAMQKFLQDNPGYILHGEVYGAVQKMTYGHNKGQVSFACFDVRSPNGQFMNYQDARNLTDKYGVPWVPIFKENHPFNFEEVCALAEGNTLMPNATHIREGVVVKPMVERTDPKIGRVMLKWVNPVFSEKM